MRKSTNNTNNNPHYITTAIIDGKEQQGVAFDMPYIVVMKPELKDMIEKMANVKIVVNLQD